MIKNRDWYALSSSGKIWVLGNCGNYDTAEETANAWRLEFVWIADGATVKGWADSIDSNQCYELGVC